MMKMLARSLIGAAMLAAASSAHAEILTVDVWTPLPGTTLAAQPELAGLALEDELQAFSFATAAGTISGTVQSRVVRSSVDGTLDFYWRIVTDRSSSEALTAFRLGGFYTPLYDANWRMDGEGDTAPVEAKLFPGAGGNVNFRFSIPGTPDSGIAPGMGSYYMMLDTSALTYARTARYDMTGSDGSISGMFETFAPGQIPEPGTLAVFTLGLAGLGLARRRKDGTA
ncbi:PEP-CTERM sorting domain-containing protein [Massilia sp. PAMC28688]|uniref:PEP-CTERM sorting domain-containing protein n=1 Tax=Massilia sp. PAMC28688 TaxID=2861283 RepID=UPI001C63B10E|nr:PEP-CTERM sorting domain-containing protein [Massilia sp. PAMC28688]QYF93551.1 PEP-CTERM sorting domain-containing protein [Massilia sp. PAMC28688]